MAEVAAVSAIVGLGALAAGGQIAAGKQQSRMIKAQGEYDAQVYEQQAEMIQQKQRIEADQANRAAARMRGSVMAKVGKSGFMYSGSPLAVMVDNETQMELDKSIGQYNLEVQRRNSLSGATWSRYAGSENARIAKNTGYTNAFSTMLMTGVSAATAGIGGSMFSGMFGGGAAYGKVGATFSDKLGETISATGKRYMTRGF
jgi:hypothetical protein